MCNKHLHICLLALMVFITAMAPSGLLAGQNAPSSAENLAADIFVAKTESGQPGDEAAHGLPVGPALLFLGIVLLAASGRQYTIQNQLAHTQLLDTQEGLEALIDESATIDDSQYHELNCQLDSLNERKAAIRKELQLLRGETS